MFRSIASFRNTVVLSALLVAGLSLHAQKTYLRSSEPLILDQKTVIPGKTLDPGTYSIRILDQFTDRFILQVEDSNGTTLSTFIGLYTSDFDTSLGRSQRGPIFWASAPKGAKAIRAFAFRNGNTLDFAYPKAEAVTLAKLNTNSVPAIDPESEGRKPDPKLSLEDRQVVTLWELKATHVGPKDQTPAIEAKRYTAPLQQNTAPSQVADSSPRPTPPIVPQARQNLPEPVKVAKLDIPPRVRSSVKRLPQTASELPMILLLSLLSLMAAGGLSVARNRA